METQQSMYVLLLIVGLTVYNSHGVLQDFLPKLRSHLLPRIVNLLKEEQISRPDIVHAALTTTFTGNDAIKPEECVFLDKDRIYHHKQV